MEEYKYYLIAGGYWKCSTITNLWYKNTWENNWLWVYNGPWNKRTPAKVRRYCIENGFKFKKLSEADRFLYKL